MKRHARSDEPNITHPLSISFKSAGGPGLMLLSTALCVSRSLLVGSKRLRPHWEALISDLLHSTGSLFADLNHKDLMSPWLWEPNKEIVYIPEKNKEKSKTIEFGWKRLKRHLFWVTVGGDDYHLHPFSFFFVINCLLKTSIHNQHTLNFKWLLHQPTSALENFKYDAAWQ